MLRITNQKGFQLTFENGWTVSIQFGFGNYCANYDDPIINNEYVKAHQCPDAEIAAWDKDKNWYQFTNDDQVSGYHSADSVARFIEHIRLMPASDLIHKFQEN